MESLILSAIISKSALRLPVITLGMMEASTTRSPLTP